MKGKATILEKVVRVGPVIPGDGWITMKKFIRPVTLECGHVRSFKPKAKIEVGQKHECFRCEEDRLEAGTYFFGPARIKEIRMLREMRKIRQPENRVPPTTVYDPYEWHEIGGN